MSGYLKVELLKLKRSNMLYLLFAGTLCSPLLNFIVYRSQAKWAEDAPLFYDFVNQTILLNSLIIGTLLYGLYATYLIEREYSDDMMKHLFSLPTGRGRFLLAKVFILAVGLVAMATSGYLTTLLFSLIGGYREITLATLLGSARLFYTNTLLFLPLLLPIFFVTFLFKNFVAPIAAGIVIEVFLFMATQSKYIAFFPWSAPLLLGVDLDSQHIELSLGTPETSLYLALGVGVLSFLASLVYLGKAEIN